MILSKKNPLVVILMGKSGSGKGTQGDFLVKKFGLNRIVSGDLLRARAKKNDFTGRKQREQMLKGLLTPMCVIFKLWLDKVEEIKNKNKNFKGLVMDGNPRRLLEAHLIDQAFEWYKWDKNVKAILVDISDKEAIWRLTKRRMCQDCKELIPFVGEFRNMKKCPKCGGKLITRADDTVKSAKNRLKWFKTDVQPIIDYYKKSGRLVKINGEQPIEDVFKDILRVIR
ncbi:MAG: nucleoside monophosphate kinase [Candidatus Nealsonbacteria bacterium]